MNPSVISGRVLSQGREFPVNFLIASKSAVDRISSVFFKHCYPYWRTMSESGEASRPLPVNDDVVVKLPKGTQIRTVNNTLVFNASESPIYSSTKEVEDKIVKPTRQHIRPENIFTLGMKVEILEPGKKWVAGNLSLSFVFEFSPDILPDEPEITSESPLDDIRKAINRDS